MIDISYNHLSSLGSTKLWYQFVGDNNFEEENKRVTERNYESEGEECNCIEI